MGGPFRLDFIKENAIWLHLCGGIFTGEEQHYRLPTSCGLQLLGCRAMQR